MRIENRKAKFDYLVVETIEAGIVLMGSEVKSIKSGQASLEGARIVPRDGALWVIGMQVPIYKYSQIEGYDPIRSKKLLIKKEEMIQIEAKSRTSGLTMIPLSVYNKGALIKLEIGLVRGKKKYEKREQLKRKTIDKELAARLKKINK